MLRSCVLRFRNRYDKQKRQQELSYFLVLGRADCTYPAHAPRPLSLIRSPLPRTTFSRNWTPTTLPLRPLFPCPKPRLPLPYRASPKRNPDLQRPRPCTYERTLISISPSLQQEKSRASYDIPSSLCARIALNLGHLNRNTFPKRVKCRKLRDRGGRPRWRAGCLAVTTEARCLRKAWRGASYLGRGELKMARL